ncbi:hypothetical protein FOZ63_023353, partial [Perkinsus olseni]
LRELENDYKERCREVKIVARQQDWLIRATESVLKTVERHRKEDEVQEEVVRDYKLMRRSFLNERAEVRKRRQERLDTRERRRAVSVEGRDAVRQRRELSRVHTLRELVETERAQRMDEFANAMDSGIIPRFLR